VPDALLDMGAADARREEVAEDAEPESGH